MASGNTRNVAMAETRPVGSMDRRLIATSREGEGLQIMGSNSAAKSDLRPIASLHRRHAAAPVCGSNERKHALCRSQSWLFSPERSGTNEQVEGGPGLAAHQSLTRTLDVPSSGTRSTSKSRTTRLPRARLSITREVLRPHGIGRESVQKQQVVRAPVYRCVNIETRKN